MHEVMKMTISEDYSKKKKKMQIFFKLQTDSHLRDFLHDIRCQTGAKDKMNVKLYFVSTVYLIHTISICCQGF